MAVAFPLGVGISLVLGTIINYIGAPAGNPVLLFIGVALIVVAIICNGVASGKVGGEKKAGANKGIILAAVTGTLMAFFYRFVAASMDLENFAAPAAGKVTPYTAIVIFSLGVLASNFIFNTLVMRKPFVGEPVTYRQYFAGNFKTHLVGMLGLLSDEKYERYLKKQAAIKAEEERIEQVIIAPSETVNALLVSYESTPIKSGVRLAELLRRPELDMEKLAPLDLTRPELDRDITLSAHINIKYEGYIKKQLDEVERARKLEEKLLDEKTDYTKIKGLRIEAAQKLSKFRPLNIGQASRISGVNPADISVLLIWLKSKGNN